MLSNSHFGFGTNLNSNHTIFNLQTQICIALEIIK